MAIPIVKNTSFALAVLLTVSGFVSAVQKRSDDNSYGTLEVLVQKQAATIQALQAQLANLDNKVTTQLTNLDNKMTTHLNTKVYFTAQLYPGTYAVNNEVTPIKFDSVMVNEGSGYSASTGRFTAPVSGSYVFHANIMNYKMSPYFHWGIQMSTGSWLCRSYADNGNHYDKGNCFAISKLTTGQSVYVLKAANGEVIEGNYISSFSGFLLNTQ